MSRGLHARSKRGPESRDPARAPRSFNLPRDPALAERLSAAASSKPTTGRKSAKGTRPPADKKARLASTRRASSNRPKPESNRRPKPESTKSGPNRFARPKGSPGKVESAGTQSSSAAARATALARRRRIPIALAALFAAVVLTTSFPMGALLSQHHQLAAAARELHRLQHSNGLLAEQKRQLNSKAAIERLARADYQLVLPGQTLYDVLPPGGVPTATLSGRVATAGDPGTQPLVAPSNAPDMSPDPSLSAQPAAGGSSGTISSGNETGPSGTRAGSAPIPSSFWSRVTNSLEFWK